MRTVNRFALMAVAAVALSACEQTTAPTESLLSADDLALIAADAALEDLSVMSGVPLTISSSFTADGRMGFERSRSVTWFDEAGATMERPDRLLTASALFESTLSGSLSRGPWSASVERSRSLRVSGLLGEEVTRTFDGTGSEQHSRSRVTDENGTRAFEMTGTSAMESVVRAVDRAAQPWPLSGTIRRDLQVQVTNGPNGDVTHTRSTVLTFNGTQFVTLIVDGEAFEVDLAARAGDRGVSRMGRNHG